MSDSEKTTIVEDDSPVVEEEKKEEAEPTDEAGTSEPTSVDTAEDDAGFVRRDHIPFVTPLKSSPFYHQASGILHWSDPVQSALVFGIGNFFFFLITYGEYSVLTLISYLALALIFVCGAYVYGTMLRAHFRKEKAENPFQAKLKNPFVASKFSLEPHADSIIGLINDAAHLWRSVLYFTDATFSLKFAFAIWVFSVIGKCFSGITLLYMTFLTAFIWPRIYQEKQAQIDEAYELALSKINHYVGLLMALLPLKKKTE